MQFRQAKGNPLTPARADYRIIRRLMKSSLGGKVLHLPDEYDLLISVFQRAGGSWEGVFVGSMEDLGLLKRVIKVAYKRKHLTRAPRW